MSRQESTISNSDIIVGDSITVQYCFEEEAEQLEQEAGAVRKQSVPKKEGSPATVGKVQKEQTPPREPQKSVSNGHAVPQRQSSNPPTDSALTQRQGSVGPENEKSQPQMIRRDSLFEEVDVYEPPIHENFQSDWNSSSIDGSWKQFSIAAARRMRRFLDNLHDAEWDVTILRVGKIKSYAPRVDHIVLDLECRPRKDE